MTNFLCLVTKLNDCQTAMSIDFTMCFQLTVCFWISTKSVLVSPWISTETLWIWGMFPTVWVVKESVFSLTVQTVVQWGALLRTELDWQIERESLNILKLYGYRTLNRGIDLQKKHQTRPLGVAVVHYVSLHWTTLMLALWISPNLLYSYTLGDNSDLL